MSGPRMIPRIDVFESHKRVPSGVVDAMCKQMVCLEREGRLLTEKLGVTTNHSFSTKTFKNDEFGPTTPEDSVFFAAMDGDELAGYSLYRRVGGGLRISALYVAPRYRRQGNGRRLMESVLSHIESNHPGESIEIGVIANNVPALMLYNNLGFTVPTHRTLMRSK